MDGGRGGDVSSRLSRRLSFGDAVVVGLAAMIGAGVFSAVGPAARAAGGGLLVGLGLAGAVAYCNAMSSAWLAAVYPESGGAYVYGRRRLGPFWGHLAGWGFVVGKVASCAAMALTFGAYAAPSFQRPLAITVVAVLTAIDYFGVNKTVRVSRVLVALVLASLAAVVVAAVTNDDASLARIGLADVGVGDARGILQSAGLLFFAFAGYARLATLGEEVVEPARTIPRAIPVALGIALVVYALVFTSALAAVGPQAMATDAAPLATVAGDSRGSSLVAVVRAGAAIGSLGVLLSLIVGVSRTAFAMAAAGDLPAWFAAVHPAHAVPHRAEVAVGAVVAAVVAAVDLRGAIGFSAFAVLVYYAIANASAFTLRREHGRSVVVPVAGLAGCVLLALTLPGLSVATGGSVLAVGAMARLARRRRTLRRRRP